MSFNNTIQTPYVAIWPEDDFPKMGGMGERDSIQTTAAGEDLWRGNELTPAPTSHVLIPTPAAAGEQMQVVSESANDAAAGSGAKTVTIEYIDAAGDAQTTTAALNGTTAVDLTPSDVRFVNDFYVSELGAANTSGVAAGPIKIWQKADNGLVYSMIAAGGNMTLVPHRMVPAGKKLVIRFWCPSEKSSAKRCTVRLRADCNHADPPVRQAGVQLFKATAFLNGSSAPQIIYREIPSLCIVKVSAWAEAVNSEAAVVWWGHLIDA